MPGKSVARRIVWLTCLVPLPTLARFCRCPRRDERGSRLDEAYVPAKCPPQEEDSRLPEPDGDQGRPQGVEEATGEGTQTADRVTGRFPKRERLTGNSEFQALFRNGHRTDRPLMVVLWRTSDTETARRAGFTVSRQVRGAVARNRVKRRLRAAYRGTRKDAPTRGSFVIIGRPAVLRAPMVTVIGEMQKAFQSIPGARSL